MRCDVCNREIDNNAHFFSGYGWFAAFHAEHCPREMDGMECDEAHLEHTSDRDPEVTDPALD